MEYDNNKPLLEKLQLILKFVDSESRIDLVSKIDTHDVDILLEHGQYDLLEQHCIDDALTLNKQEEKILDELEAAMETSVMNKYDFQQTRELLKNIKHQSITNWFIEHIVLNL